MIKDYNKVINELKQRLKVAQKELTTYRKYGQIVRGIRYIIAYNAYTDDKKLIQMIKDKLY